MFQVMFGTGKKFILYKNTLYLKNMNAFNFYKLYLNTLQFGNTEIRVSL